MELGDGVMFLLEALYALEEREGYGQAILFRLIVIIWFRIVQRTLHLPDRFDESLRFFGEVMFFFGDEIQLIVKRLRESGEELQLVSMRRLLEYMLHVLQTLLNRAHESVHRSHQRSHVASR